MNKTRLGLYILIGVMLISLVGAVPPVTTVQQFTEGFEIKVPTDNVWKIGQDFEIEAHVFNISNGLPIIADTDCYLHLYNSSGMHTLEMTDNTSSHTFDYSFYIKGGNLTKEVTHYIIQCNSSTLGGFHEVEVMVTSTGYELSEATAIIYIGLLGLAILVLIASLFGMTMLPERNARDGEGKLLSISYLKYFRNILMLTSWMLFIGILFLASNLSFAYLGETMFAQFFFMLFRVCFGLTPIIVIVWMIWIIVSMFHDKQLQNLLNRGMFPQGKI